MTSPSPILVLQVRAEARAILLAEGEFETYDEAVTPLFDYAIEHGLAELIGADTVFAMIVNAFKHQEEAA